MAIDKLQEKIRKVKNPTVVDLCVCAAQVPPHILEEEETLIRAYGRFYHELLSALKGVVPAVRFSLGHFSLLGPDGLSLLHDVTYLAKEQGFYVFLDGPESLSVQSAVSGADALFAEKCPWWFDALVVSAYAGSDVLKPYVSRLKESKKDLFVVLRTANKSASELQDLLSGSRLVYMAAADKVSRQGVELIGRSGYSQVAGVGPASSADSLRNLREKYKNLFLLIDGYDYSNSNAKNCSFAFDKLGHGAIACTGSGITAAWDTDTSEGTDYIAQVVEAAERMKKNLLRYITVL